MKAEFVWICFEFWLDVPIWISKLQWTRLRFCSLNMFEILILDWTLTSWKLLWYRFCRSLYFRVETSNMLVLGATHPPLRKFDSYTFEKSSGQWSLARFNPTEGTHREYVLSGSKQIQGILRRLVRKGTWFYDVLRIVRKKKGWFSANSTFKYHIRNLVNHLQATLTLWLFNIAMENGP